MAEPTLIAYGQSNWGNQSSGDEVSDTTFTWQTGDVFHVLGATEDSGVTLSVPISGGSNLTFTLIDSIAGASNTTAYYWRGTAVGASSGTPQASAGTGGTAARGISWFQYRGTTGQGTSQTIQGSAAKTINVTRTGTNSHVIAVMADWNAINDVVVDATPTGTVRVAAFATGTTFFVTSFGDQGSTGTNAYGITNHTGAVDMTGIAVEIFGTGGGGGGGSILRPSSGICSGGMSEMGGGMQGSGRDRMCVPSHILQAQQRSNWHRSCRP